MTKRFKTLMHNGKYVNCFKLWKEISYNEFPTMFEHHFTIDLMIANYNKVMAYHRYPVDIPFEKTIENLKQCYLVTVELKELS